MCFNSAKSNQSSDVNDNRVGADNGAIAFRSANASNDIIFGSDETAQLAIEASTNALVASTDFIGSALTSFFNLTDKRLDRADNNIDSQNKLNAELLQKEQESSDDRLIKIIKYAMFAGLGYAAIKSGVFKDITRLVK